jgi:two-component system NtrC family sensor kinase
VRSTAGTARRLFVAFALLVSVFAAASWSTLVRFREIDEGLATMRRHEEGMRVSLELASAVRDQYAHQAHTIILGNDTHLGFYTAAERRVGELTRRVGTLAGGPKERECLAAVERATAELDRIFRARIVPAVLRRDTVEIQAAHGAAQVEVTEIQDRVDCLVARFEEDIAAFQGRVASAQRHALRWTVFFTLFAPLLAASVGAYVHRSVAVPVARLHEGAARIAAGDLGARIDVDTPDEFGALAGQFNAMTESLRAHQEQLVQSEKLAGIGRLAAGVAHEINNPLAVILGYVRLLQRKAEGGVAEDLRVVEDETVRAKLIVDGLLDLSRPLASAPEPVDLRALCDEVVARLREVGALEGVAVEVAGEGRVQGHPQKLRQVILNLVRNAAEAGGVGGRVVVRVEAAPGGGASLTVDDTGPGLAPEARARLFEPFFTTKESGTGLGLAVSQGIVRAHGGELEAGAAPAGGARFTVRLPPAPPGGSR